MSKESPMAFYRLFLLTITRKFKLKPITNTEYKLGENFLTYFIKRKPFGLNHSLPTKDAAYCRSILPEATPATIFSLTQPIETKTPPKKIFKISKINKEIR